MRIKTLCYDGEEFKIAPLTVDQSDELTSLAPADTDKMSAKDIKAFARSRAYKIVPWGLNNAVTRGVDGQLVKEHLVKEKLVPIPLWDEARCRRDLDEWLLYKLMDEILSFTHMEPASGEARARREEPGEKSVSTSAGSAAA